ncbi:MAG: hypothetical protein E7265_03755 [Lachnospiraceae bacterium]|nr:hypothetical protein [Lachnospiraceae bacterium]
MNDPPKMVHRSTVTVPYFEDNFTGERAARDEETGKTYYVPDNMTYKDWYDKYVENSKEHVIIKLAKSNKIKGKVNTSPKLIDVSDYLFDDKHINKQRNHKVSKEDAIEFIKNAVVSIERWGGQFVCYYGFEGATYIDTVKKNIRTSFRRAEYDDKTEKFIKGVEDIDS